MDADWIGFLFADASERGTGTLEVPRASELPASRDLRILVAGPGVLRGRVIDESGRPFARMDVAVLLDELDEPTGGFELPEPLASRVRVRGGGRIWAESTTDAEGRFEIVGLRDAGYVLRARRRVITASYPVLIGTESIPASGEEREYLLRRPHAIIRPPVLLPLDVSARSLQSTSRLAPPSLWPRVPRFSIYHLRDGAQWPVHRRDHLMAYKIDEEDTHLLELDADERYIAVLYGDSHGPAVQHFETGADTGLVELEFDRPKAREFGQVELEVLAQYAEGLVAPPRTHLFEIVDEPAEHALPLLARSSAHRYSNLTLPAGSYRIIARSPVFLIDERARGTRYDAWSRAEKLVEVRPNVRTAVELHLERAGYLEIEPTGVPTDLETVDMMEFARLLTSLDPQRIESELASVRIELRAPDRAPFVLTFDSEFLDDDRRKTTRASSIWPLGERNVSLGVPTGTCDLVARLPGDRVLTREVTIRPTEITRVALDFPFPGQ